MNKYLLLVCMFLTVLLGCSSNKYGYSIETWNNLTQLERNKIETEASENVKNMKEEEHERAFLNRPVNKTLGSRSNVF